MAECPRCEATVREGAVSCDCGWRARAKRESKGADPLPFIQCAHETCRASARVKIRTATGWARFCEPHYEAHFDAIAKRRIVELGLNRLPNETPIVHRKRMMAYLKANARVKTFEDAMQAEDAWSREEAPA